MAERECEEEIKLLRDEAQQRAKLLELKKRAEESRLEYQYEDAMAREERLSNNGDIDDEELSELPIDRIHDRVSRLELNSAPNTQNITGDKRPGEQGKHFNSGEAAEREINPSKRETSESCGKKEPAWRENCATGSPSVSNLHVDELFEKMLPAFIKIVKPNIMKFSGNPLEYSIFKAAFKVEIDKRGVYDGTEKLKFLLQCRSELSEHRRRNARLTRICILADASIYASVTHASMLLLFIVISLLCVALLCKIEKYLGLEKRPLTRKTFAKYENVS